MARSPKTAGEGNFDCDRNSTFLFPTSQPFQNFWHRNAESGCRSFTIQSSECRIGISRFVAHGYRGTRCYENSRLHRNRHFGRCTCVGCRRPISARQAVIGDRSYGHDSRRRRATVLLLRERKGGGRGVNSATRIFTRRFDNPTMP